MLRWLEGFETRRHALWFGYLYELFNGSTYAFTAGRKAGFCLSGRDVVLRTPALVSSPENTWVVGWGWRRETAVAVTDEGGGIRFLSGEDEQCRLHIIAGTTVGTYRWQLRRDTTVIATSRSFLSGSRKTWTYFMLKVTARTGASGAYELKAFDRFGTAETLFSGSGVNLAHSASDGVDRVEFRTASGQSNSQIDDIFVLDSTGTANNDFPASPWVVQGTLPDADGNQNDWSIPGGATHFNLVDEAATDTVTTGFIQSADSGDVDLFSFGPLSAVPSAATVRGIHVVVTGSMVASGTKDVRPRVRSGANEATGAAWTFDSLVTDSRSVVFQQNPTGTPADWTKTSLEAAEIGVEVV